MKTNKHTFIFLLVLSTLSAIGTVCIYDKLPGQIPIHFDFHGNTDSYGPKFTILLLAVLPFILALLYYILPKLDPRKKSYTLHHKAYSILYIALTVLIISMDWLTILIALGCSIPMNYAVSFGAGLIVIICGNFLPQIRPNYFLGIRTPWALESPYVWKKTHTFGGIVMCIMGMIILLTPFMPEHFAVPVFLTAILGGILLIYIYSFIIFKKAKGNENVKD